MRAITVLILAAAAVRLDAQSPASPVAPAAAFESFLRVVALTDHPVEAVSRVWPLTLDSRSTNSRLSLSAAHSVDLILGADPLRRDNVVRLLRATWTERVADTLALRRRVSEVLDQVAKTAAKPDKCSDPLGPPGYLFVPQHVVRFWTRGLSGRPTQLAWDVAAGPVFEISISVGHLVDNGTATLACDAKLP